MKTILLSLFLGTILLLQPVSILSEQTTGQVSIVNIQNIEVVGTATFTTPEEEVVTFTLPEGESGTLTTEIVDVNEPTSGGTLIKFLGNTLSFSIEPTNSCNNGCVITFTFTDDHLAEQGIPDPNDVIIFQDPELDGTFVPLPTLLIDGAPSPYTVLTTITSTSFFAIAVLAEEAFCGKTLEQWESEGANIVFGTEKRDKLRGTKNVDVIFGLGGNDRILGKDGDDCLIGGEGNDRIIGGKGDDIIFGNDGNDRLHGAKGNDTIDGGNGNDRVQGNKGNDQLSGGDGNDKLFGNKGDDVLFGISGDDEIRGNQGNDTIDGGDGIDTCEEGEGADLVINCEN